MLLGGRTAVHPPFGHDTPVLEHHGAVDSQVQGINGMQVCRKSSLHSLGRLLAPQRIGYFLLYDFRGTRDAVGAL